MNLHCVSTLGLPGRLLVLFKLTLKNRSTLPIMREHVEVSSCKVLISTWSCLCLRRVPVAVRLVTPRSVLYYSLLQCCSV